MSPGRRADGPRAVVTGVGVVSAWGWGRQPFWDGLLSGETAIGGFSRFEHTLYRTHVAGEVPPPPAGLAASIPGWRHLSWADRFAVAAAREALEQAGLNAPAPGPGERTAGRASLASTADAAVFFGSSTGGMLEGEEWYRRLRGDAAGRASLGLVAAQQVSAPGDAVARFFDCGGPVETVSSACASGALALARALDAVRSGETDIALAGGADSLCRVTYGGFNSLRSVDERPCLPFRADRAGLSIGEGGAVLVVENAERAAARGARPLVGLLGAGASSDASHMTAPHPEGEGAARALSRALADAGIPPAEIVFVNAHGTGTPLNDAAEWRALAAVFGAAAAARLPVTATKGAVGHLLGTAGAIEAAATVLSLVCRVVPPTPGGGEVDAGSPVDLVRGAARRLDGPRAANEATAAVSLNLAFGGCNAALVFARWPDAPPAAAAIESRA